MAETMTGELTNEPCGNTVCDNDAAPWTWALVEGVDLREHGLPETRRVLQVALCDRCADALGVERPLGGGDCE